MSSKLYDVLIIGGGPAGLSIAAALARQVYTALVLDSGEYRNASTQHMHNVVGFDHVDPAVFRAKARADLEKRYKSVEFRATPTTIQGIQKLQDGTFEAVDEGGETFRGRKLALGTGVRDLLDGELPGYADCWGRSIFHCLFCHGFEERGAESAGTLVAGLMSSPPQVAHVAHLTKRLSKHTTIYTNGNSSIVDEIKPLIHSSKVIYDTRPITKFELLPGKDSYQDNVAVHFSDGTSKTEGFIASHPMIEQRAAKLIGQLGLETAPTGEVVVNAPWNQTSVEGCFAAGDMATPLRSVVQALQMGQMAGAGAVGELMHELDARDEL